MTDKRRGMPDAGFSLLLEEKGQGMRWMVVAGGLLLFFIFFCVPSVFAQVDAGPDVTISPGVPVKLTARYGQVAQEIRFAAEDGVEGPFPIGFNFTFYGNGPYSQFWVGANGWISFIPNTSAIGVRDAFAVPSQAPYVPKACILGPFQDLDPGQGDAPYVFYRTVDNGTQKKLVVMWCQCPLVNCTGSIATFQITLNENNTIENHLYQKPECSYGGTQKATQGIQDQTGFFGVAVPGNSGVAIPSRNATVWSVLPDKKEGWIYTPTSPTTYDVGAIPYIFEPISPSDKISFRWYEGSNPEPISNDSTLIVTPVETTTYKVIATLCNGEEFTDLVRVTVKPNIPTAFTPNGDNINEEFVITGLPVENIALYHIQIYNRWGQEVFNSNDIQVSWNGKMNNTGDLCPDGTYTWVIYYEKADKVKVTNKGTVTLLR
ncbi:MAG: gliding motility-associated C-terminal domain-containing protein [Bacteroidales bacterium]|nr:gliding motility-associated C-terminal domain-containing protein [Bacteroidales bacterium]